MKPTKPPVRVAFGVGPMHDTQGNQAPSLHYLVGALVVTGMVVVAATPRLPSPEHSEASSLPTDDRLGSADDQRIAPVGPRSFQSQAHLIDMKEARNRAIRTTVNSSNVRLAHQIVESAA